MTFEESSERIHLLIDAMTKAKELGDAIFGAFRLLLDGISRQAFANVGSAAGNVVNDPVHEWHRFFAT